VTVKVGSATRKTECIQKNLNPVWNEKFIFQEADLESAIVITMEDVDMGGLSTDFMGKVTIPLVQLQNKKPVRAWKRLGNKLSKADTTQRGEIEILLHWKYNPNVKIRKQSSMSFLPGLLGHEESDEEAEVDNLDVKESPKSKEQEEEEKKEKEEKEKALKEEIGDIQIKSGDYQIQVHIIEVRDLKAEDENGLSDPVVYVEAFGQKRNTKVMPSCLSAAFDERFIFNYRDMDKETFDAGQIRVNVMDADFGSRNDMIGSFVVDASQIYFRPKHEFYREWVALIDDTNISDQGVQGYLKLSISIIGPGEKMPVHDEESDKAEEKEREERDGISPAIPPSIKRTNQWLVTKIYRAEYLPVMDASSLISTAGIDAFVQVDIGTAMKRTRKNKVTGDRAQLNPIFNSEIWTPVTTPIMSDVIRYSIWDWDRTSNSLVSTVTDRFNLLNSLPSKKVGPHWCNLYGAQLRGYDHTPDITKAFKKEKDWKAHYNKFPDNAPHYRGRILLEQRIVGEGEAPKKKDGSPREVAPFRLKLPAGLKQSQQPKQATYKLRMMTISGTEIPQIKNAFHIRKMQIKLQCGRNEIFSSRVENNNGVCEWNHLMESEDFIYPEDPEQCPDIVISICKGKDTEIVPVAYKRFKFKDVLEQNFQGDTRWITFEEDKALDCLADGQFPGSALIRFGVGTPELAQRTYQEWEAALYHSRRKTPYQLRCHIYQARSLPASDANGLMDPYFKINFNGQTFEAKYAKKCNNGRKKYDVPQMLRKKTCDPLWYGVICFDTELPEAQYFPQVNFQLYDWDGAFDKDDYNGCFNAQLSEDNIHDFDDQSSNRALKPQWYPLMKEEEGDCEGEVLCCFQLLKKRAPEMTMPDPPSIKPALMDAFVEIVAIGCRDLSPYNFLAMQYPKVEFALDSDEGTAVQCTDKSKRPSGSNPNFLERIVLKCRLPEDPEAAIYAPPVSVKVYDYRLAGMVQPICGVAKIDLSKKLPWSKGYEDPTLSGKKKDVRAMSTGVQVKKIKQNGKITYRKDDSAGANATEVQEDPSPIAPLLPKDIKSAIQEKLELPDTGAGVFGALKHIKSPPPKEVVEERRKSILEQAAAGDLASPNEMTEAQMIAELEAFEDAEDTTKRYMIGREKLPAELEEVLPSSPFENFTLWRGQGKSKKEVGVFKGLVRVVRTEKELDLKEKKSGGIDMQQLLKPQQYTVRLYVLRALNLAEMDIGMFGRPGKSDPYLKVNIGDDKFNDKENYVSDATDVDFYKCIELHTELPGAGQLEIEVMDYDFFGSDDLIGKTVVDLEDRWFDQRWQRMGIENKIPDVGKTRWATKPLERRSLFTDTKNLEQGKLECYVDIMPSHEAEMYPKDDIELPPSQMFEVRVVVWRARDMVSMDVMEDMNDLYFTGWVEGCEKQSTDIHWRARNGKGSFNWRMKFDVELGHNTTAMKFPYLHMQAWDKDLLKYSDCIAESFIDLGKSFKRAYKKNQTIEVYKKRDIKRELESVRFAKAQEEKRKAVEAKKREEQEAKDEEDRLEAIRASEQVEVDIETGLGAPGSPRNSDRANSIGGDSLGIEEDGVQLVERGVEKSDDAGYTALQPANAPQKKRDKKNGLLSGARERASTLEKKFSSKEAKKRKNEEMKEKKRIAKIKKEREAQAQKDELENLLGSMKEICGVGDDPPASTWVKLMRKDFETGEEEEVGEVAISVSIIPKNMADSNPAGFGRKEPNNDPYLPEPQGRLKFTLNPFSMGTQLFGPALCARIACCLCCVFGVLLTYFIAPYLNIIISLTK